MSEPLTQELKELQEEIERDDGDATSTSIRREAAKADLEAFKKLRDELVQARIEYDKEFSQMLVRYDAMKETVVFKSKAIKEKFKQLEVKPSGCGRTIDEVIEDETRILAKKLTDMLNPSPPEAQLRLCPSDPDRSEQSGSIPRNYKEQVDALRGYEGTKNSGADLAEVIARLKKSKDWFGEASKKWQALIDMSDKRLAEAQATDGSDRARKLYDAYAHIQLVSAFFFYEPDKLRPAVKDKDARVLAPRDRDTLKDLLRKACSQYAQARKSLRESKCRLEIAKQKGERLKKQLETLEKEGIKDIVDSLI